MKRFFGISAALAIAVSFAACQKIQEVSSENTVSIKVVTDGIINPENAVKTYLGINSLTRDPEIKWNLSDNISLYEFVDDAVEAAQTVQSNGTLLEDDCHIASFNVPLRTDVATGTEYTYEAIYPAEAVTAGGSGENKFNRVCIKQNQTAQFIDDDTFTANFDPTSDVLVGTPITRSTRPVEDDFLGFRFKRVGTIGKLTVKGLQAGEIVKSVEISLPEGNKVTGYSKINVKEGSIYEPSYSSYESVKITVPSSESTAMETYEGLSYDILFRCLSGTWKKDTPVTVKVETSKTLYTKTTELPKDYEFIEGGLTSFIFNMETADKQKIISDFAGDWMIVSKNVEVLYAMSKYESGKNNIAAVVYSLTTEGKATSDESDLNDCCYTFTKVADGDYAGCYTIQDVDGNYIYAAGSGSNNYLKAAGETAGAAYYWDITLSNGAYSIVAKSTNRNTLQYNTSSKIFSCYGGSTQSPVELFPWDDVNVDRTPVITVSSNNLGFNADGTAKNTITVSGNKYVTGYISATPSENWLYAYVGDGELVVAAEENTGDERTATITLSYDGAEDVVINVTQNGVGSSDSALTFDFTTSISGWPSGKSYSAAGNYTYSLGGTDYIFSHTKEGDGIYFSTFNDITYLMICSGNMFGLPAIAGYKLTKVVANNTSSCSTGVYVGISTSATNANYVSGGEAQNWSNQNSAYTYVLAGTEENTVYFLATSQKNAQINSLELTYETATPKTPQTLTFPQASYTIGDNETFIAPTVSGAQTTVAYSSSDEQVATVDPSTGAVSVVAAGTTTITATAASDETYASGNASYTLIVNGIKATASKTSVSAAGETITITVDTNVDGWSVESDNDAFTVGAKSGNTVPVVVSKNESTTDGRTAHITVSATGVKDVVITLTQAKAGGSDGPAVGTVLWGETFDHFGTKTPSSAGTGTGTTIYGGASISYNQSVETIKGYNEKLAGGTAPELLLSKSNQTWTISGIYCEKVSKMSLTFLSNKTKFNVSSATAGISISGSEKSWTITNASAKSFELVIKNTDSSNNARIDNVVLEVAE